MYDEHFFAQIFERKIRMYIIHECNYYQGYNNLMYNVHKTVGAHYTQQNTVTPQPKKRFSRNPQRGEELEAPYLSVFTGAEGRP